MRLYRRPPITDDSPVPPMDVSPATGLTVARIGKKIVAATASALKLTERSYPDMLYFPRCNVDPAIFLPASGTTRCPWRGEASYFDVDGHPRAAFTYYEAAAPFEDLSGRIAFDRRYVDVDVAPLPETPAAALNVLHFWFEETPAKMHFAEDEAFDMAISAKFAGLHEKAAEGALDSWMSTPEGALALIILLDQFSRNMFRGSAAAFARDRAAQGLAARVVELGFDLALAPDRRAFAYMPFMHAEDLDLQNRSVALFGGRLPGSTNVGYALGHRETIHHHGRFPGRDEALGRAPGASENS